MTESTNALSVLQGMYAAERDYLAAGGPGRANFALLAPYFAPDVVLYQAESLPYGGTWRGHEGMERFFLAMAETWETFDLLEQEFIATETKLVVHTHVRARARASGEQVEFPILQAIAVEGEGDRITEIRPFYWDTGMIARACAVPLPDGRR